MLRSFDITGLQEIEHFALAIVKTKPDQDHSGILYRDGEGKLWLMHFAWHHKLCSDSFCFIYQWAPTSRPRQILKLLAILCEKVRTANPKIPYGFDKSGIHIDKQSGQLVPGNPGKGFTCSTFILGLLGAYSIRLLDESQWPENANMIWQHQILASLLETAKNCDIPEEHLRAVQQDVGGARRFTPAEVVGASTEKHWPVSFKRASRLAAKVSAELDQYNPEIRWQLQSS